MSDENKNKPTPADVNDAIAVHQDKTTNRKEKAVVDEILKNASSVQINKAEKLSRTREKGMKAGGSLSVSADKPAWMRNR